jgi:hypothetical protein
MWRPTIQLPVLLPIQPHGSSIEGFSIVKSHFPSELKLDRSVIYPSPVLRKTGDDVT